MELKNIAGIFNTHFVNVASNLKEPLQLSAFENLRIFVNSKVLTFFDIPVINVNFVKKYLSSLDTTKSTGQDCIGPNFLKLASLVTSQICGNMPELVLFL